MVEVEPELSINQCNGKSLIKADTQRHPSAVGSVVYRHISGSCKPLRHPLQRQPATEGSVESIEGRNGDGHVSAPQRYLAGIIDSNSASKQGDFKMTIFSDGNWSNNTNNGESMSPYVMTMYNGLVGFQAGM